MVALRVVRVHSRIHSNRKNAIIVHELIIRCLVIARVGVQRRLAALVVEIKFDLLLRLRFRVIVRIREASRFRRLIRKTSRHDQIRAVGAYRRRANLGACSIFEQILQVVLFQRAAVSRMRRLLRVYITTTRPGHVYITLEHFSYKNGTID